MKYIPILLTYCFLLGLITGSFSQSQPVDSLTLARSIEQVMKNDPLIEQAEQQARASRARVDQARSFYYPEVDAAAQYSRVGPVLTLDLPGQGSFSLFPENNYEVRLGAEQTVFDFGKRSARNALAVSEQKLAEDNIEQVKTELAYQTVQTFYTILFLQENIRVLDEEIQALNAHLSNTKKKAQTGSAVEFDVLTTRVRVANARSEKVDVESALQKQTITLKRLTGIPEDQEIYLQADFTAPGVRLKPDSLISAALARRSEMILARDAESGLEIQEHLASLGDRPVLSADFSLGVKNGYIPDLNQAKVNWLVGLGIKMPLFNGFQTRYRKVEASANLAAARAHTREVAERIHSDVRQALADIRAKQEKIQASALQVEQAEQALSLAKQQYEIGVITNLDLLDAQTSHLEASLIHLKALYNLVLSRYALEKASGNKIW